MKRSRSNQKKTLSIRDIDLQLTYNFNFGLSIDSSEFFILTLITLMNSSQKDTLLT